jgi:PKD repeat protein
MRQRLLCIALSVLSFGWNATANHNHNAEILFDYAYTQHPEIPRGMLEAVSYTMTRITHISKTEPASCTGLPQAYGVMGLTLDGKGYFRNNLEYVAQLSGFSEEDIIDSENASIVAYAAAYGHLLLTLNIDSKAPIDHLPILVALSELPISKTDNDFAINSHLFSIYTFLNDPTKSSEHNFPVYELNLPALFGKKAYHILSSRHVMVGKNGITDRKGNTFTGGANYKSVQYAPAIWNPAPSCNYSSRSGTAVSAITIHTIQGSYAGAISWALNCNSSVSYHYVIRSADGQVSQLVDEADKAWHVGSENPYTIGYEHEGYVSNPIWYTTAMYNSSAALSRDIIGSGYGISGLRTYFGASSSGTNLLGNCTKIKGHQHYANQSHTDPGINWDWEHYYQLINNAPIITMQIGTTGNFYDSGGPSGDYLDDERDLTLIQPAGATTVTITFTAFNLESNWDYLLIYDGSTTADPLIGVYTGTNNPGTITGNSGALLIEFRSDCSTTASGWVATWTSTVNQNLIDSIAPTTNVGGIPTWATTGFTASFTDADNNGGSGLEKSYYNVADWQGTEWRANSDNGFFNDDFDNMTIHSDWTQATGTWAWQSNTLGQTDEAQTNSNLYATLDQTLSNRYLYHFAAKIDGAGTSRRAGFHFFCDAPTLTNRGNSYFVWLRVDDNKLQIYSVDNDVFALEVDQAFTLNAGQYYDVKVAYDRMTGQIDMFVDNVLEATWTDPTPLSTGNSISFRSGNANFNVNHVKVYRSRAATATITVGNGSTNDVQSQNQDPLTAAGRISSIVIDSATNLSTTVQELINVDWTNPTDITTVNDGNATDIDTFYSNTEFAANWSFSTDPNSAIARYRYAIGTSPGATDVVNWTDNWFSDTVVHTGLTLTYNITYYICVKSENGAGLESNVTTSDGTYLDQPTSPPTATYNYSNTIVCAGDSIYFSNSSANATSYAWTFQSGSPAASADANPVVAYATSGTFNVTLIATGPGGSDTTTQSITTNISLPPVATFTANEDTVWLNNPTIYFTNTSSNGNGHLWDFGDASQSTDLNPWHTYGAVGSYDVMLIAINGNCANDTTFMTVVVRDDVGINDADVFNGLVVHPNPTSGNSLLSFTATRATALEIRIVDLLGQIVWQTSSDHYATGKHQVLFSSAELQLAAGIYSVQLLGEHSQSSVQLIVIEP